MSAPEKNSEPKGQRISRLLIVVIAVLMVMLIASFLVLHPGGRRSACNDSGDHQQELSVG